jgi:hypothetical protein
VHDLLTSQAIAELRGDAPLVDHRDLEALARAVRLRSMDCDAIGIAESLALHVAFTSLPTGVDAVLVDQRIFVRRLRSQARTSLLILHECAHHALKHRAHSHGDVWMLSLALAMPTGLPAARRILLPAWANSIRSEVVTIFS